MPAAKEGILGFETHPSALSALSPPRSGADVSIKNAEGKTAGEVAEMNEQVAVVALLKGKEAKEAKA